MMRRINSQAGLPAPWACAALPGNRGSMSGVDMHDAAMAVVTPFGRG